MGVIPCEVFVLSPKPGENRCRKLSFNRAAPKRRQRRFVMSTDCLLSTEESFAVEMHRLLETASHAPWGPGREIDEKVHTLHMQLLSVQSRLGRPDEKPEDTQLAHSLDHELRNKLMIFHYHEQKRRVSAPPLPVKSHAQKKIIRRRPQPVR